MNFITLDIGGSGIKIVEFSGKKMVVRSKKIECKETNENKRCEEFIRIEQSTLRYILINYPLNFYPNILVSNCGSFNSETYEVTRWNRTYYLLSDLKKMGYVCYVLNDGIAHPYSIVNQINLEGPILSLTFGTGIGYSAFNDKLEIYTPCETDDIIRDHRVDDLYPDKDPHELLGFREMMFLWNSGFFDRWEKRFERLINSLLANLQPKTILLFGGITQTQFNEGYTLFSTRIIPLIKKTYYYKKKGLRIEVGGEYSANMGVLNFFGEKILENNIEDNKEDITTGD